MFDHSAVMGSSLSNLKGLDSVYYPRLEIAIVVIVVVRAFVVKRIL